MKKPSDCNYNNPLAEEDNRIKLTVKLVAEGPFEGGIFYILYIKMINTREIMMPNENNL